MFKKKNCSLLIFVDCQKRPPKSPLKKNNLFTVSLNEKHTLKFRNNFNFIIVSTYQISQSYFYVTWIICKLGLKVCIPTVKYYDFMVNIRHSFVSGITKYTLRNIQIKIYNQNL